MKKSNPLINFLSRRITPSSFTFQSTFDYSVENFATRPCISFVDDEVAITYAEFGQRVNELGSELLSAGFVKGDKIALLGTNMPNWVIAYYAIVTSGLVVVPILPDFSKMEIESVLLHSESKGLFISEKQLVKIDKLDFPALEMVYQLEKLEIIPGKSKIKPNQELKVTRPGVGEDDLVAIIYTSGTTGRSKGVMLTNKNIVWDAYQSYTLQSIDESDIFLSFLPLSHTYENTIGMVYPLMQGASVRYLDKPPTPAVLLPAMAKIKPTLMLSVPLVMEKLYKSQVQSKFTKTKFTRVIYKTSLFRLIIHRIAGKKLYQSFGGNLKFFGIGGSKLDSRVERFLKEAKFPYAIGYGLTETSPLIAGAAVNNTKLQSTGAVLQGVEIRLDEPNKKGVGEIWVKGHNVMQGYYKNPELTAEVLTEDGWFKTGDLGYMNRFGRLYIKGRKKSTIIGASGENIYPEDIESVINNAEFVVESLVLEEDGFLVAKVLLNLEELEKNIENFKINYENRVDKLQVWKNNFTKELNAKLNKVSQIKRVDVIDEPFEKTASMKIKRFLYTKDKDKKKKKE